MAHAGTKGHADAQGLDTTCDHVGVQGLFCLPMDTTVTQDHGVVWARAAFVALLQLGSVLLSVAPDTIEGHQCHGTEPPRGSMLMSKGHAAMGTLPNWVTCIAT